MNRGDIYTVTLDPPEGGEQRGHRPVLVVSATAFNAATQLPVVLPITTGDAFARRLGFAVPIAGGSVVGVVRCDQPQVLDVRARRGLKVDTLSPELMDEVLARLTTVFE